MKALTLALLLVPALAQAAPDRIGNGGGLWVCGTPSGDIESAQLVDFFEAYSQYSWQIGPPVRQDPFQIADNVAASLPSRFPDYATAWSRELENVKARKHMYQGLLEKIDDVRNIGEPSPSACHGARWQYVQFANYDDNRNVIQIRQELWDSPRISVLDKAGLLWHEAIYRWMRDQFGDSDSVRARQVVGILFSTLDPAAARQALDGVLKQDNGHNPPDQPTYVCLVKNGVSMRYFLDYGASELAARNQAVKTCRLADQNLLFHCDEFGVRCDSFTSQKQAYTCAVKNGVSSETYTETGRSPLEAEAKARRSCTEANPNLAVHCQEPTCN